MENGLVYVVHNDWIQNPKANEGYKTYKIGITANSVSERYYGLGLKMPSEFVCDFAYEFDAEQYKMVEKGLHAIFDQSRVGGEWFDLKTSALNMIRSICEEIGGKLVTDTIVEEIALEKRPKFDLTKMGIPIGGKLVFCGSGDPVEVEVVAERRVKYNGKEYRLTALTSELRGVNPFTRTHPMPYWTYKGTLLEEMYNKTYPPVAKNS